MNPNDLKYTTTHEWIRVEGDVATIGITAHAAESLSDLVYLGLPEAGDAMTAGESFGEIESVKAVSDLNSPVNGEVLEANSALEDNLATINSDPYGEGWLVKVKLSGDPPEGLMDVENYEKLVAESA
ncbi:MAG: glycine cleavage system protein GcvH [Planctomycetota bacterium]|jgi:glycine cleavage system H protein